MVEQCVITYHKYTPKFNDIHISYFLFEDKYYKTMQVNTQESNLKLLS